MANELTATTQTGGIHVTGTVRDTLTATASTGGVTVALQDTPAKSLIAEAKTGDEERGVTYETAADVPINPSGEVEDEAISRE